MLVVPGLAIHTVLEERNHVLVRLLVKVMHLVALVEHVCHEIRWWRVGHG